MFGTNYWTKILITKFTNYVTSLLTYTSVLTYPTWYKQRLDLTIYYELDNQVILTTGYPTIISGGYHSNTLQYQPTKVPLNLKIIHEFSYQYLPFTQTDLTSLPDYYWLIYSRQLSGISG